MELSFGPLLGGNHLAGLCPHCYECAFEGGILSSQCPEPTASSFEVFGTTFANRAAGKLLAQRIAAQETILDLTVFELSSGPLPAPTRLRTIRLYSRPRAETWG